MIYSHQKPPIWSIDPGIVAYNCQKAGMPHPVLALPMWEGAGNRVIDLSGRGNHGEVVGACWTLDGLDFNGASDYVTIPDDNSLDFGTEDFSVGVWFRSTGDTGEHQSIFAKQHFTGESPASEHEWMLYVKNVEYLTFARAGDHTTLSYNGGYEDDNLWHFSVTTRAGGDGYLYVDGVQVDYAAGFFTGYSFSNNLDLWIGKRADGRYFSGDITNCYIVKSALSAAQIKSLYDNPYFMYQIPEELYGYVAGAPPAGAIMNQFQHLNLGSDLFNGALI